MGSWVRVFAFLIRYRFREDLTNPLKLRDQNLTLDDIQKKAVGSLTSTGVFFGLSVALMAAFLGDMGKALKSAVESALQSGASRVWFCTYVAGGAIIPYLIVRAERGITAASVDAPSEDKKIALRASRRLWLLLWFCIALLIYLLMPIICVATRPLVKAALPLSGFALIIASVFFLLFALEFYDSASSWRGNDPALHFHLATIAATSYLFGICLALTGASLLLYLLSFWAGSTTTIATLLAVTAMSEIERDLWDLRNRTSEHNGSSQDELPL
jgi:hypothetical protein